MNLDKTVSGPSKIFTLKGFRRLRFPERPVWFPNHLHIPSNSSEYVLELHSLVTWAPNSSLLKD